MFSWSKAMRAIFSVQMKYVVILEFRLGIPEFLVSNLFNLLLNNYLHF
jgi:hypothetical protein